MSNVVTLPAVQPLARLAGDINRQHAEVGRHAKGMLMAAKAAGEMLLQAKGLVKHGEFKAWVKENCAFSYDVAVKYMRVARRADSKSGNLSTFEGGMVAFLDAHAEHKENPKPSPNAALTTRQVQKVKKLHALATSTANEEEADTAQRHLESYANSLGMSADKAVRKAYGSPKAATLPYRNPWEKAEVARLVRIAPSKSHLVLAIQRLIDKGVIPVNALMEELEEILNVPA